QNLKVGLAMEATRPLGFQRIDVVDVMLDACLGGQPSRLRIDGLDRIKIRPWRRCSKFLSPSGGRFRGELVQIRFGPDRASYFFLLLIFGLAAICSA